MSTDQCMGEAMDEMNVRVWSSMLIAGALFVLPGFALAATPAEKAQVGAEKAADRAEKAADKAEDAASKVERKTDTSNKTTTSSMKTPVKDSWVTSKTKIALFADSRVKGRQVNVETKKGVVMLRGKVDTAEAKSAAEEITKGIDGAQGVKNELQVVAPSKRDVVDEKDDVITTRVKKQIAKDANLKKGDITVKTNAGVVSLTGSVKDMMTSAQASWTAWKVPGVKSVKNDLTVTNNQ